MTRTNAFGQPIGDPLIDHRTPDLPSERLPGSTVTLEPLSGAMHAPALFGAYAAAGDDLWTYMPWGPFAEAAEIATIADALHQLPDWQPYALVVDDAPIGMASFLRIDRNSASIEIGGIAYSPALQRTTAATEAMYLMIEHAFAQGYRRCEWKCDALNAPSRAAAERLGFTYEGTFRQATHYKGRNRDTAWFAIVDADWPALRPSFVAWLDEANFDTDGRQRQGLAEMRTGRAAR